MAFLAVHAPGKRHRFSIRLFLGMLGFFVVLFGGEAAIDIARACAHAERPFGEVWPEIAGSWYSAVQAGGCLARASYCMLGMCLSIFLLSIPFASTFYTPKLIEVYLRDRTNRTVFALGVLASALAHFQTTTVWPRLVGPGGDLHPAGWAGFYPAVALWVSVALIAAAWAALLPYALYAFRFLVPEVMIDRIEEQIRDHLSLAMRSSSDHKRIAEWVRQEIFDLGNLALRAIDRTDRDLAVDVVRSLGRAYRGYLDVKAGLPAAWFEPRRVWFTGLSEEAFRLIADSRTWVGHLILHQISLAYFAALAKIPDTAAQVAAVALGIAGEAGRRKDASLLSLSVRTANTLIREAIKRGDPGVVQDTVRIHREMIGRLAALGSPDESDPIVEAAEHLTYYHAYARDLGMHGSADVIALSLARTVELAAKHARRALEGVAAAFERLQDLPPGVDGRSLLKARTLVASCLQDAGLDADAGRLLVHVTAASADDRTAVRAMLAATGDRTEAGREAFGAEPGLEFVQDPRRTRMMELLGV